MGEYFHISYGHSGRNIKTELDLSNFVTKKD